MTFNDLLKANARRYFKVSFKRRTGNNTWEEEYTAINNNRIINIGKKSAKIGEKTSGNYLTNTNITITLDNYDGYFRSNTNSHWQEGYYFHLSQVKIEMGFEKQDGSIVWADNPFFEGVIDNVNSKINRNNTIEIKCLSILAVLINNTVDEILTGRNTKTSASSLIYSILSQFTTTYFDLGFKFKGVSLRKDYLIEGLDVNTTTQYDVVSDILDESGSRLNITKDRNIYVDYFGYVAKAQEEFTADDPNIDCLWVFNEVVSKKGWDRLNYNRDYIEDKKGVIDLRHPGEDIFPLIDTIFGKGIGLTSERPGDSLYYYGDSNVGGVSDWEGYFSTPDFRSDCTLEILAYVDHCIYTFYDLEERQTAESIFGVFGENASDVIFKLYLTDFGELAVFTENEHYHTGIYIADKQWALTSIVLDYSNKIIKIFLNGELQFFNLLTPAIKNQHRLYFGGQSKGQQTIIDCARVFNIARSEAEIKNTYNSVLGSKLDSSSVKHCFNGVKIVDYKSGIKQVSNYIHYQTDSDVYYVDFEYGDPSIGAKLRVYYNRKNHGYEEFEYSNHFKDIDSLINAINNNAVLNENNMIAAKIDDTKIRFLTEADPNIKYISIRIGYEYWSGSGFSNVIPDIPIYGEFRRLVYSVKDTESILKNGKQLKEIKSKHRYSNSLSISALLSGTLENEKQAKDHISIETKLWENQPDLMDQITIKHKPPSKQNGILAGMRLSSGLPFNQDGGFGWTSKNCFVVGIEDYPSKGISILKLREV